MTGDKAHTVERLDVLPATPLFLARQPILSQEDWQNMLQTGAAGSIAETIAWGQVGQAAFLHWGRMLLTGQGTRKDRTAAFAWFQKVAEQEKGAEQGAALNMLGQCYMHGWGVEVDLSRALACYERAAERGDVWAMFNLADCYRKGVGCERDACRAARLYEAAAAKGHVKSLNMLGLAYEEGCGVERNETRAAALFAKGADGGDCWASFNHARQLAKKGEIAQSLDWLARSLEQQSGDYCQTFAGIFANHWDERLRALAARASCMAKQSSQQQETAP